MFQRFFIFFMYPCFHSLTFIYICVIYYSMIGKLYGNGSSEDSTRLNHKDVFVASENEHKHEPSVTIRKGGGWGKNEGGFRRGKGGGSGCGKAGTRMRGTGSTGVIGGASYRNAAPSLFPETRPKFILYLSLILIALFPIH